MIRINLLGSFNLLERGNVVNRINSPRSQALLAFFLLNRDTLMSRRQVAAVFWPEATDSQARNNLRQALHHLRHALPYADRCIQTDSHTIQWLDNNAITVDVDDFHNAIRQAIEARKAQRKAAYREHLIRAAALYRGDLLPDCYDDWIARHRESFREHLRQVLTDLVTDHEAVLEYDDALQYATRLAAINPLDEDECVRLMRLFAAKHDSAGITRAYEAYTTVLRDELRIEPSQQLRDQRDRALKAAARSWMTDLSLTRTIDADTPLVGRERELSQIMDVWRKAANGGAHLILIQGEAGIGKTRLAEEVIDQTTLFSAQTARSRAYAAEGRLAYAPIAGILRSDMFQSSLSKLDSHWLSEVARILPELGASHNVSRATDAIGDKVHQLRFFESLAQAVLVHARPTVLLIDDLQWCDLESLEWIRYFLQYAHATQVLLIGTVRTEEVGHGHPLTRVFAGLQGTDQLTTLDIGPLSPAASETLSNILARRQLSQTELKDIYSESAGNPLYVIETLRAGLHERVADAGQKTDRVPPRIQSIIRSRLATLSPEAINLLNLGALSGRAFSLEMLKHAGGLTEEAVAQVLDDLWRRKLIRANSQDLYDFTHDRILETILAEISPAKRRILAKRVAVALEHVHRGQLSAYSAQLAALYTTAGLAERALAYYQRAVEVAKKLFAYNEVVDLIERATKLLSQVDNQHRRDTLELDFVTKLGTTIIGSSVLQVGQQMAILERARDLCRRLDKDVDPAILKALAINRLVQNDYQECHSIGLELLRRGEKSRDSTLSMQGHQLIGQVHAWLGRFHDGATHLTKAIELYDVSKSQEYIALFSWDPGVICQCRLALTLWCLGHSGDALRAQNSANLLALKINHPFSTAYSHVWDIMLHLMLGDSNLALEKANVTVEYSRTHGMKWWLLFAKVLSGCALVACGRYREGADALESGISEWQELGSRINYVLLYGHLAKAFECLGNTASALVQIDHALDCCRTQDSWYEAEIHRQRGDLLMPNDEAAAEAAYLRALDIARSQSAKSYELRSATSLARLWAAKGKFGAAIGQLRPICDWFSQDDTGRDITTARSLLYELTLR